MFWSQSRSGEPESERVVIFLTFGVGVGVKRFQKPDLESAVGVVFFPVIGNFAVRNFAVGNFAVENFAVRKLGRKEISP